MAPVSRFGIVSPFPYIRLTSPLSTLFFPHSPTPGVSLNLSQEVMGPVPRNEPITDIFSLPLSGFTFSVSKLRNCPFIRQRPLDNFHNSYP